MLIQNLMQNLPAFLGFLIGSSWLIYTSLLTTYKLDLIRIALNWFATKKVLIPSLVTLVLPFLFMYLSQEIPILVDRWKIRDFIGILGAVVGAIIGFFISEFRQWKTEGQQINAVRKMLNIEINQNLLVVAEFKNKADLASTNIIDFIIKNSFPTLKYKVWESQVMLLPIALLDKEINQIYMFYKELENIVIKYDSLNNLVLELNEIGVIEYSGVREMIEAMRKSERRNELEKRIQIEWQELNKMITKVINNRAIKNI